MEAAPMVVANGVPLDMPNEPNTNTGLFGWLFGCGVCSKPVPAQYVQQAQVAPMVQQAQVAPMPANVVPMAMVQQVQSTPVVPVVVPASVPAVAAAPADPAALSMPTFCSSCGTKFDGLFCSGCGKRRGT